MGSTPRKHRLVIPLYTRSSDVKTIERCPAQWALSLFHEGEDADASFYVLGDTVHRAIERIVRDDLNLEAASAWGKGFIDASLERLRPIQLETTRRGFDTIEEDFFRMLARWWQDVHPRSEKRMEEYQDLVWPPRVEVRIQADVPGLLYPVWGSIDALFQNLDNPGQTLVDWKTGADPRADQFQFEFYLLAGGFDLENTEAWFHHIDCKDRKGKTKLQFIQPFDMEDTIERIAEVEQLKEERDLAQANTGWWCPWCPVAMFCPTDESERYGGNARKLEQDLQRKLKYAKLATTPEKESTNGTTVQ
jgi:hypothetical protein